MNINNDLGFTQLPGEVRLDHFLRQRGSTLSLDIRLDLARQIADAVRYAHGRRVIHRALSPKSILVVRSDSDGPQARLGGGALPAWRALARRLAEAFCVSSGGWGAEVHGDVDVIPAVYDPPLQEIPLLCRQLPEKGPKLVTPHGTVILLTLGYFLHLVI